MKSEIILYYPSTAHFPGRNLHLKIAYTLLTHDIYEDDDL